MTPPSKRRKNDIGSSRCDLQPQNADMALSSSSLTIQSKGSKITSLKQDPTKRVLKNKTNQVQNKARASNSLKFCSKNANCRKTVENIACSSNFCNVGKPNYEVNVLEKAKNEGYSALLPKGAQTKTISRDYTSLSLKLEGGTHDSISRVPAIDEDLISDWDEDDCEFNTPSSSYVQAAAKKRGCVNALANPKNARGEFYSGSQRFIQKSAQSAHATNNNDFRPWAERFAPTSLKELAVHKQKVADVKTWLEDVFSGKKRQRLLLLKGAPGSGKTTTIKLLAEFMECQVLEWRNPVGPMNSSDGTLSMSAQFEEFLGRGYRFGQLDFSSTNNSKSIQLVRSPIESRRRIILIEEFPNTFTKTSPIVQSFQSDILNYLISNTPSFSSTLSRKSPIKSIVPLVMVVSETLLSTFTASADSFTAHRLLGPKILQHPGVTIIEFNPIAPSFLTKALELVIQKEAHQSGRKTTPGLSVLKRLGESGDIRSAIGSLEFLCLLGDNGGDWSAKVSFGNSRGKSKEVAMTKSEKESLELITQREVSLGIFHAVGKVIYNRRKDQPSGTPITQNPERLPSFLTIYSRPKPSLVSVNELIDETGTDTQTFISALHENYLLSCDASPSCFEFSTLDHVNGCIDALSDSDLACLSWHDSASSNLSGDHYHRNEIAFQIAVRGLLFSLPHPVTRKAPAASRFRKGAAGEAYNMFYPTSLKLWRTKKDVEDIASLWVNRILKGDLQGMFGTTTETLDPANPNRKRIEISISSSLRSSNAAINEIPPLPASNSGWKVMLLEQLPYLAKIMKSGKTKKLIMAATELEKVTTFIGIGRNEELPVESHDTVLEGDNWATDEPDDTKYVEKPVVILRECSKSEILPTQLCGQKMTISDDDIEDD